MSAERVALRTRLLSLYPEINDSTPVASKKESKNQLNTFGRAVLTDATLRELVTKATYEALIQIRDAPGNHELTPEMADEIANAMKEWATRNKATHYTHRFQPMTGSSAEKSDSFLTFVNFDRKEITLELSGQSLRKGEPDASSFPSGGIRSTFEARGYTAWDMSTPAFLRKSFSGQYTTLCIPTVFCSYTGEALDLKTPLLRSEETVSKEAVHILSLLRPNASKPVTRVFSMLGAEQEFFLIDRGFYQARPDLVACGRTLLGARSPKGQELEDHYFGKMPPRVLACLEEVDKVLWELGVPSMTRHNEVSPAQYEMALIYEKSPIATDHNVLVMEILCETARKHGLVCLLHEKPFAYVNGSGKHHNWSLATESGENLFSPGSNKSRPENNLSFMVFLTALIRAVHLHGDLLRAAVAIPGNDHRLGACEAPPVIISIFLGTHLDAICRQWMGEDREKLAKEEEEAVGGKSSYQNLLKLGLKVLSDIPKDSTDRNRTSPFAFTGDKFEFRAPGSSQVCAFSIATINTIMAESLRWISGRIEAGLKDTPASATLSREEIISRIVAEELKAHYDVVFNGNNYSDEWRAEAKKRGLAILPSAPEALRVYDDPKKIQLFESMGVLTKKEMVARSNILNDLFLKQLFIEVNTLLNLVNSHVVPAAMKYQLQLAKSLRLLKETLGEETALEGQKKLVSGVAGKIGELFGAVEKLKAASNGLEGNGGHGGDGGTLQEKLGEYHGRVLRAMRDVRAACDQLEEIVDDAVWPLPKYSEMLFLH